jgi:hypothetical protein
LITLWLLAVVQVVLVKAVAVVLVDSEQAVHLQ